MFLKFETSLRNVPDYWNSASTNRPVSLSFIVSNAELYIKFHPDKSGTFLVGTKISTKNGKIENEKREEISIKDIENPYGTIAIDPY